MPLAGAAAKAGPSPRLSSRTAVGGTTGHSNGRDLVIGEPVLVSHFSASPRTMRMFPDGLSSILSSQAVTQQMMNHFRRGATTTASAPTDDDHHRTLPDGVSFAMLQPSGFGQQEPLMPDCGIASSRYSAASSSATSASRARDFRSRFLGAISFAMLQPSGFGQQEPLMPDCGIASSRYSAASSSATSASRARDFRSRFLGASNRRMGMVLLTPPGNNDSSTSSSSAAAAADERRKQLRRNRPRDMSCDPSLMRGLPRHDRIYDRVARDDLYCDSGDDYPPPAAADLLTVGRHYDRYAMNRNDNAASSGLRYSGDVLSDGSQNYDDSRNLLRQDVAAERDQDRSLASDRLFRSRLIVNADGYYGHIPANGPENRQIGSNFCQMRQSLNKDVRWGIATTTYGTIDGSSVGD
ncbi:unnamed protein product [Gongylonema pulchrum]|uniref:Uncharacterized protein n=1 Tax=Gongylonema pulchrum TaxID=637853 RepID=A0A183EE10_9BILA|nr:unnamed protein product [Gongylonema pulchrum]